MPAFRRIRRRAGIGVVAGALLAAGATGAARATAPTPSLDLRVAEAAYLRIGDAEQRVRRLWGRPASTARPKAGHTTLTYGFAGGTLAVFLDRGRVRMVALSGSIRTTRRDRVGTTLATFRDRWGGSVHRSCCAVGVRHVRVATNAHGAVYVATFVEGRLLRLSLTTDRFFRTCFLAECD